MSFPSFSAGEVLTAADMNAVSGWLVKTQTVGTGVSSVAVTSAFSTDYDNYAIIYAGGTGSTPAAITFQLTGSTAGYYSAWNGTVYSTGGANNGSDNNTASWTAGAAFTEGAAMNVQLLQPFKSVRTGIYFSRVDYRTTGASAVGNGFHNTAASYTGFTIAPSAGTLTGGIIRVYGYRN
jgi:hypothetical protein